MVYVFRTNVSFQKTIVYEESEEPEFGDPEVKIRTNYTLESKKCKIFI